MNIYEWITSTFFTKDINKVLSKIDKTAAELYVVHAQQQVIADDLDEVIALAQASRQEADMNNERALCVAKKLGELLS